MGIIKTFEGFFDFIKGRKPHITTYYWTNVEKRELIKSGLRFIDNKKSKRLGHFEFREYKIYKIAEADNGREDWYYELVKDEKTLKKFETIGDIKSWIDKNSTFGALKL